MGDNNQSTEDRRKYLEDQLKNLQEEQSSVEMGEQPATAEPKSVSASKTIINISYGLFAICGIAGSFWAAFDMVKYVEFIKAFAFLWAPLVISVGGGRAFKNYVNKKYAVGNGSSTGQ